MAAQRLRNIRPRPADVSDDADLSGEDEYDFEGVDVEMDAEEADLSDAEGRGENSDDEQGSFERQVSNVSFGALKRAQEALPRKRKRGSDTTPDQEDKLQVLRERLRQIKQQKANEPARKPSKKSRDQVHDDSEGDNEDSDSDSGPSEEDLPGKARTSKHAPTAQSSKHQVTRKRQVVDVPKRVVRDPRFDALHHHQRSAHPGNSEKAYSFLRDYQKSEIEELREAAKRIKNEDDKYELKRKIGSLENRLKAKEAKEREQEIVRQHRKDERERVEQGKSPYYLKKKDIKEKALVEKFKKMKSKDREKLIEKRRKKEGQKEKKRMPDTRRSVPG